VIGDWSRAGVPLAAADSGRSGTDLNDHCAYALLGLTLARSAKGALVPGLVSQGRTCSTRVKVQTSRGGTRSCGGTSRGWKLSLAPRVTTPLVVGLHHVWDPCDPEFVDVTEFDPVNAWESVGEGVEMGRAGDPESALRVVGALGAVPERW
jgi:hypothetical protein